MTPPSLVVGTERSATRLELFFDLAFVLAVARTADRLGRDLDLSGAALFLGLVTVVWWAWASSTLYANRFDTDDLVYRGLKLAGMLAVIGLAASASEATTTRSTVFALCYVALRLLLVGQYARAWRHVPEARPSVRIYLRAHAASAGLWLVSVPMPEPWRYVAWGAGVTIEMAAPLLSTRGPGDVPLHLSHLPERFALFVILVLGESVTAIVDGLTDADWRAPAVVAAGLAFLVTAGLWWSYFDLAGGAAKKALQEAGPSSRHEVHDVYLYAHLPIAAGLIAVGVGLEHAIVEAGHGMLSDGTRWTLAGGVALYLATATVLTSGLAARKRGRWSGLGLGAPVAVTFGLLDRVPPAATLGLMAALMTVLVVAGLTQSQTGRLDATPV